MKLDEGMRRRFRDLADEAEAERAALSPDAVDRIVAATLAEADRTARRRIQVRVAAVGALAMAAASILYVRSGTTDGPGLAATRPDAPRCAAMSGTAAVSLEAGPASRHTVGSRARLDAATGTRARIEAPSGCTTEVVLLSGSVAVWARDLAQGTLTVAVGDARVIVHGTVFEVRAEDDGGRYVAVREGRVEVARRGNSRWLVGGQALRIGADGSVTNAEVDALARLRLAAVTEDALPEIGAATSLPVAPTGVVPSTANAPAVDAPRAPLDVNATLRAAELAYREGRVDEARRLFRQVGATRGASAEAAWIRLGRLELRAGRPAEAARALADHRRRFPSGSLAAEARVVEAQALRALGRGAEAQALERWVLEQRPDSPQANALRARGER